MVFESDSLAFYDGVLNGDERFYVKADIVLEMLRDIAHNDTSISAVTSTFNTKLSGGEAFDKRLDPRAPSRIAGICQLLRERSGAEVQR